MNAADFWRSIRGIAEETSSKYKPFRAKAVYADNNGVQIQPYGSDALGERFAQLRGPQIQPNDEVAVLPYGGSSLVLGTVGNGPVDYNNAIQFRGSAVQPFEFHAYASDTALVSSSTAISTYVTVYEYTLPIANGTWFIQGFGGCQVRHLTSNNASCYVQINNAYRGLNKMATTWTGVQAANRGTVTVTDGQYTIAVKVMTGNGGGMEMSAPWFMMSARRTA